MAITTAQIKIAIETFLNAQYEKKAEPLLKKREKTQDSEELTEIEASLRKYREKYTVDTWLSEDAVKYTRELKFGTHLSKGIHPDSRGDNVNFRITEQALPEDLCGSQCVPEAEYELDANGNAAALPLAGFMTTEVMQGISLRDLLIANDPALKGGFGSDPVRSDHYQELFREALLAEVTSSQTDARNKQLLWPNSAAAIAEDNYTCLIPLHPAALSHHIYRKIKEIKSGEKSKSARTLRRETRKLDSVAKVHEELATYRNEHDASPVAIDFGELAYVKLGGSKPQNISLLNSQQGGRQYLLPALPPTYQKTQKPPLRTSDTSFFSQALMTLCKEPRAQLKAVINARTSTWEIRETRRQALDGFAEQILIIAADLAQTPGWTDAYPKLSAAEKYWLDPENTAFSAPESIPADWRVQVAQNFAAWLQAWLRRRFPKIKSHFDDVEYQEWLRWFSRALKAGTKQRRRTE